MARERQAEDGVNMRLIGAGIASNVSFGLLYGWSLFVAPLETFLGVTRTQLSVIPSLALVAFTAGLFTHQWFTTRARLKPLYGSLILAAVIGHVAFAIYPTYPVLILGYACLFGYAGGIAYCISLALAREASPQRPGIAVGWMVGAFAATGLGMSIAASWAGIPQRVDLVFAALACAIGLIGLAGYLLLPGTFTLTSSSAVKERDGGRDMAVLWPFLVAFFGLCYAALSLVGHGTPLLRELNAPADTANLAPLLFNSGYIAGAVTAGYVLVYVSGRTALLTVLALTLACSLLFSMQIGVPLAVLLIVVMGAALGSSPTLIFVILGAGRDTAAATRLFGTINLSYGAAGLLGPLVTGWLFDTTLQYGPAFLLAAFVNAIAILLSAARIR